MNSNPHMSLCIVVGCYRNEDLKKMLDSNKDGLKLDAMKIIIGVSYWRAYNISIVHV